MTRRIVALVLVWWAVAAPGPASSRLPEAAARAVESVSADDLRNYVGTLASDELNGRAVGDKGNRAAEEFICATLRQNGVTPAGADGSCYQPSHVRQMAPSLGIIKDGAADLSSAPSSTPSGEAAAATATGKH